MAEAHKVAFPLLPDALRPWPNAVAVGRKWKAQTASRATRARGRPRIAGAFRPGLDGWTVAEAFRHGRVIRKPAAATACETHVLHVESDPLGCKPGGPSSYDDARGGHYTTVIVEYPAPEAVDRARPLSKKVKHAKEIVHLCKNIVKDHRGVRNTSESTMELEGVMVGGGYHIYNGRLTPFVPGSNIYRAPRPRGQKRGCAGELVPEWRFDEEGDEEEEAAACEATLPPKPVPHRGYMSSINKLRHFFHNVFAHDDGVFKQSGAMYDALCNHFPEFSLLAFAFSIDLNNSMHMDIHDGWRSYAVWFRETRRAPPPKEWWLLFPAVGLAIELKEGVRVSWDGRHAMHCSISMPGEGDHLYSMFVGVKSDVVRHMALEQAFFCLPVPAVAELQKGTRVLVGVRNHCGTILSPITEVNLTEAKIHRDHGDGTFSIRTISSGTEWAPFDPSDLRIMPEWL